MVLIPFRWFAENFPDEVPDGLKKRRLQIRIDSTTEEPRKDAMRSLTEYPSASSILTRMAQS